MSGIIYTKIERVPQKLVDEYKLLPTSVVSDVMNRMNAMHAEIKPIIEGVNVAGSAVTVQCIVGDNLIVHKAIYVAKHGDVIVVDVRGHKDTSVWGNIMTKACMLRGIEAVVIDGSIRDVLENKKDGYPIFCRGIAPAGSHKNCAGNINVPIQCGGIHINPGDIIVGDDDGVAVVPRNEAEMVLIKAKEKVESEKRWLNGIRQGKSTLEVIGLDKKLGNLDIKIK
jgi:4-hydroxy-4-methyl-2-oxoglutarate aldolase